MGKILSENGKALFAYVLVCFFWGSTYLAIKIGVQDMPPMFFASVRFIVAGGLMLLFSKVRRLTLPSSFKEVALLSTVGLFMLLGGNGLVVFAEQWVDSGVASLMIATVPIFVAILEHFFIKGTKLTLKGVFGLLLGFLGVYFLLHPSGDSSSINLEGVAVLLTASFLWSSGTVLSKKVRSNGSIVASIGIQMFAGGIGLMITSLISGELPRVRFTANSLYAILYLIVFGSLIGYSSYIYLLQKWPATRAGTYAYVNPAVAVTLGALLLGERVTVLMLISMVAILVGVIIVQRSKIRVDQK